MTTILLFASESDFAAILIKGLFILVVCFIWGLIRSCFSHNKETKNEVKISENCENENEITITTTFRLMMSQMTEIINKHKEKARIVFTKESETEYPFTYAVYENGMITYTQTGKQVAVDLDKIS